MNGFNLNKKIFLPAIILLSLFVILPSCRHIKEQLKIGEYSPEAIKEWARQDSIWIADSMKKVIANKGENDKSITDSLIVIDGDDSKRKDKIPAYYIITGSFTDLENAKKTAGKYSGDQYNTDIIVTKKMDGTSLYFVSAKSFNNFNEASVFLLKFREEHDSSSWIYSGK